MKKRAILAARQLGSKEGSNILPYYVEFGSTRMGHLEDSSEAHGDACALEDKISDEVANGWLSAQFDL